MAHSVAADNAIT